MSSYHGAGPVLESRDTAVNKTDIRRSRQHTLSISCRGKSRKEGLGSEGTPRFSRIWGVGFRKEAGPPCSMMESVGTIESHGSDEKEEVSL